MPRFMDDDFLLESPVAQELYNEHAKDAPIIDFHCHLPADEIAADRRFRSITEIWLEGEGWRRVDPTAAVAPERIDDGRSAAMFDGTAEAWGLAAPSALLYRLTLTWDAMNARWNEFVLGYGP